MPCARRLLVGTLVGRLPTAMAPLALLVCTVKDRGYGAASMLAALYPLASAAGGPLAGRAVDRYGQTRALLACAALSSTTLVAVVSGPSRPGWAEACVLVAGVARPPLESRLRALWGTAPGSVMPSREHQQTALALDTAAQEVMYVFGPLMVVAIAVTASGYGALLATTALGFAGTAIVTGTSVSRSWKASHGRLDWLGPVRSARLRILYTAMIGVGIPIGALTPLAVAVGARFCLPVLAGVLPAVLSVGAVLGGLLYGSRTWPGTPPRHPTVLSAAFTVGWLPLTAARSPAAAAAAAAVAGLTMAPLLGSAVALTGVLAPHRAVTEAYALLVAALDIGCALGTAAAGLLPTPALLPAGAGAAAAVLVLAHRYLIVADRTPPASCPALEGVL
ncbi:MFS transporter [Streptomyces populi]